MSFFLFWFIKKHFMKKSDRTFLRIYSSVLKYLTFFCQPVLSEHLFINDYLIFQVLDSDDDVLFFLDSISLTSTRDFKISTAFRAFSILYGWTSRTLNLFLLYMNLEMNISFMVKIKKYNMSIELTKFFSIKLRTFHNHS